MRKASISIFKKKVDYPSSSVSQVPDELFDAVKRVIENKGSEILRLQEGFFVVEYSKNGPFKDNFNNEWLPVYVARIEQWSSGGIKKSEIV